MVQWLGLCSFTAKGLNSILGQGTKIPEADASLKKKKESTHKNLLYFYTLPLINPSPKLKK